LTPPSPLRKKIPDNALLPKDNCCAIATAISQGTARAVSNGSFDPATLKGTSALIIVADKDNHNPLEAANWVPGLASHRSKLAGVAGILSAVAIIIQHYDITTGSVTIALDGQSALDVASVDTPMKIDRPDFDLIQDIRTRLSILPITVKWKWVEGHQKQNESQWIGGQKRI
jgi:hypothetical protein